MSLIQYFSPPPAISEIPQKCRDPFENDPHPLAIRASKYLQKHLQQTPALTYSLFEKNNGKMFGVLVVVDETGKIGYLSGFSGMLNNQWEVYGFVPPVFNKNNLALLQQGEKQVSKLTQVIDSYLDSAERLQLKDELFLLKQQKAKLLLKLKKAHQENKDRRKKIRQSLKDESEEIITQRKLSYQSQQDKREFKKLKKEWEDKIIKAENNIDRLYENPIRQFKSERKKLSQQLHLKVFESYELLNNNLDVKSLLSLFEDKIPPGGSGDCVAPKLIQYAHRKKMKILALAEFWWGSPPAKGVRHHANFYPPCRGKCFPVLPFMLQGVIEKKSENDKNSKQLKPEIIFEDESLLVINKPAGMLSIPGKQQQYSVLSWAKKNFPQATGALLVHRLDMSTSGLIVIAKNSRTHKHLQKQFINRHIKKRYIAILSKVLTKKNFTVNLPLRVDLDDRPRQVVCHEYGKEATTHVKVISSDSNSTRVHLYPVTGRTHQLRVHAAHRLGLDAPIVGDELYGKQAERLMLHAEKLSFIHPVKGDLIEITSKAPF